MQLILLVEDDEKIAANVTLRLREEGFGVVAFRNAEDALAYVRDAKNVQPDMALLDVRLPGMSGVDLVRVAGEVMPPSIVMSGEATMAETVEAIRLGVHDFIDKPFSRERLLRSVRNCLDHASLRMQVRELRAQGQEIVGRSDAVKSLRAAIEKVAPTDARVLIRGESGTGKELVANAIHRLSRRASRTFVKLNCAAIPSHLIEDELFGHARGAFTDAKTAKRGLFEEADGGTLFLDEIGDMELALQARLLRVVEDGRVRRVGETTDRVVDVRVLAATHRDVESLAQDGRFREDLFFRLASVPLHVPALRERRDDVPLLFTTFLQRFCARGQRSALSVDPAVHAALQRYDWPGNVRELRNLAERLSVFATDPLTVDQLPSSVLTPGVSESGIVRIDEGAPVMPLRAFKAQCEKEYIESVLRRTQWNVSRAAQLLDLQRTYLHEKIAALGITRPE
ncbi:MAG: sigma-54-dependent Fis family transcriptional regulator [Acidobacteria bacterium]|nr:sigma-54-dependent Fis family transcriptional regulator [Acidobacteriota bacterium]MBV9478099.1 sigma-54-dependent Fis family transcriptional regulator [Acidobacteriota bacterium]